MTAWNARSGIGWWGVVESAAGLGRTHRAPALMWCRSQSHRVVF